MDGFDADSGVTWDRYRHGVTPNTVTGDVTVNGTYIRPHGPATLAHIHGLATPPTAAPVILGLILTAGTPNTSGTLTGGGTLSAVDTLGMLNGMTYLNIHTDLHTDGEIRGNIGP